MAAAVVVIQGLPPAPELRGVVLSACSDALKHRSCVASEDKDQGAPSATALIAWPDGTDRHVRVTLERFDVPRGRRIDRDTRFADEDPLVERWRTIGLVIAALVGESDAPLDGTAEGDDRSGSGWARAGAHPAAWLGLSALAGPGLDDGSVRLGGAVHGAVALRTSPIFFMASASYAVRSADDRQMDVRWTTFAVGGGARAVVSDADLALRVRFELMLEHFLARSGSGAAVSGGGSRTSPGIRGGGDLVWPASAALGMTLGFSMWSLPGGTAVQLDQRKLGSSQWLGYAGFLGAEWSFR
jgi:hypothetical protein